MNEAIGSGENPMVVVPDVSSTNMMEMGPSPIQVEKVHSIMTSVDILRDFQRKLEFPEEIFDTILSDINSATKSFILQNNIPLWYSLAIYTSWSEYSLMNMPMRNERNVRPGRMINEEVVKTSSNVERSSEERLKLLEDKEMKFSPSIYKILRATGVNEIDFFDHLRTWFTVMPKPLTESIATNIGQLQKRFTLTHLLASRYFALLNGAILDLDNEAPHFHPTLLNYRLIHDFVWLFFCCFRSSFPAVFNDDMLASLYGLIACTLFVIGDILLTSKIDDRIKFSKKFESTLKKKLNLEENQQIYEGIVGKISAGELHQILFKTLLMVTKGDGRLDNLSIGEFNIMIEVTLRKFIQHMKNVWKIGFQTTECVGLTIHRRLFDYNMRKFQDYYDTQMIDAQTGQIDEIAFLNRAYDRHAQYREQLEDSPLTPSRYLTTEPLNGSSILDKKYFHLLQSPGNLTKTITITNNIGGVIDVLTPYRLLHMKREQLDDISNDVMELFALLRCSTDNGLMHDIDEETMSEKILGEELKSIKLPIDLIHSLEMELFKSLKTTLKMVDEKSTISSSTDQSRISSLIQKINLRGTNEMEENGKIKISVPLKVIDGLVTFTRQQLQNSLPLGIIMKEKHSLNECDREIDGFIKNFISQYLKSTISHAIIIYLQNECVPDERERERMEFDRIHQFLQFFYKNYENCLEVALRRAYLARALTYRIISALLNDERNQLKTMTMLKGRPLSCLYALSLEIVMFAYRSNNIFPWSCQIVDLHPFDLFRVIESVCRSGCGFSRQILRHLNWIEFEILSRHAWSENSPIWKLAENKKKMTQKRSSFENTSIFPFTYLEVLRLASDKMNSNILPIPEIELENRKSLGQDQKETNRLMSIYHLEKFYGSTTRPYQMFMRKYYHLISFRLFDLLERLEVPSPALAASTYFPGRHGKPIVAGYMPRLCETEFVENTKKKEEHQNRTMRKECFEPIELRRVIWTIFEYVVTRLPHLLLKDHHCDYALLSSVVAGCRICFTKTNQSIGFQEILVAYHQQQYHDETIQIVELRKFYNEEFIPKISYIVRQLYCRVYFQRRCLIRSHDLCDGYPTFTAIALARKALRKFWLELNGQEPDEDDDIEDEVQNINLPMDQNDNEIIDKDQSIKRRNELLQNLKKSAEETIGEMGSDMWKSVWNETWSLAVLPSPLMEAAFVDEDLYHLIDGQYVSTQEYHFNDIDHDAWKGAMQSLNIGDNSEDMSIPAIRRRHIEAITGARMPLINPNRVDEHSPLSVRRHLLENVYISMMSPSYVQQEYLLQINPKTLTDEKPLKKRKGHDDRRRSRSLGRKTPRDDELGSEDELGTIITTQYTPSMPMESISKDINKAIAEAEMTFTQTVGNMMPSTSNEVSDSPRRRPSPPFRSSTNQSISSRNYSKSPKPSKSRGAPMTNYDCQPKMSINVHRMRSQQKQRYAEDRKNLNSPRKHQQKRPTAYGSKQSFSEYNTFDYDD
ncbi:hypothetical protein SNEBB_001145 [Seison nebaliae]|nr:hypothetical protein SNEBB_001145 [Seison nebaliae]